MAGVINKKKPSGGGMDAAETMALVGVLRHQNKNKALYSNTDGVKLRGKKMAWKPFFYPDGNAKNALHWESDGANLGSFSFENDHIPFRSGN